MSTSVELPFWKPAAPGARDLRKFGLLFSVLAALLACYLAWRRGLPAAVVPAAVSAALLLAGLAFPVVLKPVWWPWMMAARILGYVNSHLLLAAVFYLMFTPIGLLLRLLGHDPLGDRNFHRARQIARDGGSLWLPREHTQLPQHHYERQF